MSDNEYPKLLHKLTSKKFILELNEYEEYKKIKIISKKNIAVHYTEFGIYIDFGQAQSITNVVEQHDCCDHYGTECEFNDQVYKIGDCSCNCTYCYYQNEWRDKRLKKLLV